MSDLSNRCLKNERPGHRRKINSCLQTVILNHPTGDELLALADQWGRQEQRLNKALSEDRLGPARHHRHYGPMDRPPRKCLRVKRDYERSLSLGEEMAKERYQSLYAEHDKVDLMQRGSKARRLRDRRRKMHPVRGVKAVTLQILEKEGFQLSISE